MKWSTELVNQLVELVTYFRSHSIGWVLEVIGDIYTKKHGKGHYSMKLRNPEDELRIGEAEYKLAYMCELADAKTKRNVYQSFCYILSSSIFEMMMKAGTKQTGDFRVAYINLILKELFPLDNTPIEPKGSNLSNKLYSDEKYLMVLGMATQITMVIMLLANDSLYRGRFENMILVSSSANFDISICNARQGREIRNVLGSTRLIFMKILFILAYEMHREVLEEIRNETNSKCAFLSKKWFSNLYYFFSLRNTIVIILLFRIEMDISETYFEMKDFGNCENFSSLDNISLSYILFQFFQRCIYTVVHITMFQV